jgi:hypothetical protein
MAIREAIHSRLSKFAQPIVKRWYYSFTGRRTDNELHKEFVANYFESRSEYEMYVDEFEEGPAAEIKKEALDEYKKLTGSEGMGAIALESARDYYAIARKHKPSTVVETGVCNGLSTLSILLALDKNGSGKLYSIDFPFRANESLDEFRSETFENYGGAAIPRDKDPGWIVPDELRQNWTLILGKSQRELPRLLTDLETIDLFVHDSEHSHPCMMFEYELAWEWLTEAGILLSDDISWNDAFEIFVDVRTPTHCGRISQNIGYAMKDNC